jgi:hypothetical protein
MWLVANVSPDIQAISDRSHDNEIACIDMALKEQYIVLFFLADSSL